MARYVVALDQGTTSSRSMLIDQNGTVIDVDQKPFEQIYPQPGWVEHDPQEILSTQLGTFAGLMAQNNLQPSDIDSIGITNQRETTIIWNRETGKPIYNAIVWQCRRTAAVIDEICGDDQELRARITAKTGLLPDPYFSASKAKWILDTVPGAKQDAQDGKLAFGTIDTWLIWNLTNGRVHATDVTNASRTMLYDIHKGCWDQELLDLFGIPASMMPEVLPSAANYGSTSNPNLPQGIPICGVAGDQQSALFGQCCFNAGQAKNTYGTGCFLLMHTGHEACASHNNLVTTIAASAPGTEGIEYALEGSVFVAGAVVQWLRDEMKMVENAADTQEIAESVPDTGGVYLVPAFTGLGAPYWDSEARGTVVGITRGTNQAHFVRAALESMAYQVNDLMDAMRADSGVKVEALNVDGGASANDFLMQFQADLLGAEIRRPQNTETTALGAAYLAGLTTGFFPNVDYLKTLRSSDDVFEPSMDDQKRQEVLDGWKEAIKRTLSK
ncbi:MAG: glycerol kinase GlpK [Coriobacteriia bacterium]|nr:glycerol kinase GlpK [Coriobacteriia bacterium]